jgi:hypothetical protein
MKKSKRSAARKNPLGVVIPICTGFVIMLLAAGPGYGQGPKTDIAPDDFDKAAVREL